MLQELKSANERRLFQELQTTKNLVQEQVIWHEALLSVPY